MHQKSNPDVARFYTSKQWLQVSKAYRLYRHNICERCGAIGKIVHHKKHITGTTIYDPSITLNFENLELLCQDCHNKEHLSSNPFDDDGNVMPQNENAFELSGVFRGK